MRGGSAENRDMTGTCQTRQMQQWWEYLGGRAGHAQRTFVAWY